MAIEGVWSTDIGGAYGWEPIGTVFLDSGRLVGGGRNHYSSGTYTEEAGNAVKFDIVVNQFGKKRALFGQKSDQLTIQVAGRLDADRIIGEATMPGHSEYGIAVCFRKRGELPENTRLAD